MDRYEEEEVKDVKLSRIDKNRELYTDVYLNNVYVDIKNLKEVMKEDTEEEEKKIVKEIDKVEDYTYEEKNYDIKEIVDLAIKNKKDDNLKRSLDNETSDQEIKELIASINERDTKESLNNDNLLSELLPTNDNTALIPPLEEPILDTSNLTLPDEENEENENLDNEMIEDISENDLESDTSFVESSRFKYLKIIIILASLIMIGIIIVILKLKGVF